MREKYSKKTPFKRFLHKYTGITILIIILSTSMLFWAYNESTKVFFENWTCNKISEIELSNLNEKESVRYHETISECNALPFTDNK